MQTFIRFTTQCYNNVLTSKMPPRRLTNVARAYSLFSNFVTVIFPTVSKRSALSLRWPLTEARGSAPSLHKHGSSMASNSSGGGSSDWQRTAQQRLRIIAGHLQSSAEGDSTVQAAECKAQGSKTDISTDGKTMPRKRYKAVMEWWSRVHPL